MVKTTTKKKLAVAAKTKLVAPKAKTPAKKGIAKAKPKGVCVTIARIEAQNPCSSSYLDFWVRIHPSVKPKSQFRPSAIDCDVTDCSECKKIQREWTRALKVAPGGPTRSTPIPLRKIYAMPNGYDYCAWLDWRVLTTAESKAWASEKEKTDAR